eukprot:2508440-Prymnesium_polylepis.1
MKSATQEEESEKDFSMEANVKYYTSKMPTIKSDMLNAYHICDRCFDSHAQSMECECGGECYSWETKTLEEAKEMAQELEEMADCLECDKKRCAARRREAARRRPPRAR